MGGSRGRTYEKRRAEYLRAKAKRPAKKQNAPKRSDSQRSHDFRNSQTNEERAAELQRRMELRLSQTDEERQAELQRKKELRQSKTDEEKAAELQRKRNLRQSQTNEERAAELLRMKNFRQSQTREAKDAKAQRKCSKRAAKNAKILVAQVKELARECENKGTGAEPVGGQSISLEEAEQLFWASSGIDKSAVDAREACTRGADMDGHFREIFQNMVFSCAACGEVTVSGKDIEDFTIFRNDVVEAFSVDDDFQPTSERGVQTRVNDKHYTLCLLKALVGGHLCQQKDLKDGHFYLCGRCAKCLSNKTKSQLWSIDLGYTDNLPILTPVEKAAIAASRVYGTLIKIKHRVAAEHQPLLLKGHLICFPHNAAEKLSEVVFPRTSVSKMIQVHFVGSTSGWEKMQPILTQSGGILEVRCDVIRIWLQFLKENNHYYNDLKVDFSDAHFQKLQENVKKIIAEAAITVDTTFDDAIGTTVGKEENPAEECGLPAVVVEDQGSVRTKETNKRGHESCVCKRNWRRDQRV